MSYTGHLLGGGITLQQKCSQCILQPQLTGQIHVGVMDKLRVRFNYFVGWIYNKHRNYENCILDTNRNKYFGIYTRSKQNSWIIRAEGWAWSRRLSIAPNKTTAHHSVYDNPPKRTWNIKNRLVCVFSERRVCLFFDHRDQVTTSLFPRTFFVTIWFSHNVKCWS